jgi:uncharacterized protein YbjQ (UPF0145 family)
MRNEFKSSREEPSLMSLPLPSTDDVFSHNVTTSETLPGYRITSSKGMVRGISVRARALGPMICAVLQILCCGGRIAVMEYMCEQARQDAAADMLAHARRLGCNAVSSCRGLQLLNTSCALH